MSDRLYVTEDGIVIDLDKVRWISATTEVGYLDKRLVFCVYVADCNNPVYMEYPLDYEVGKDFTDLEDFVNWQKNDLCDAWRTYLKGVNND